MSLFTPRQSTRDIDGTSTQILLQSFADRIMVLVTQMGKVGNLIQASIPATTPLLPPLAPDPAHPNRRPLPPPPAAVQLTPLFGRPPSDHIQTLHSLYAAQIATILWTDESHGGLEAARRSVVVGLALKEADGDDGVGLTARERRVFEGIMDMLQDLLAQK